MPLDVPTDANSTPNYTAAQHATYHNSLARLGTLAYTESTTLNQTVTTDSTDLTGMSSGALTIAANRRIKITAFVMLKSSSAAGDRGRIYIMEGGTILQQHAGGFNINDTLEGFLAIWVGTPTAASHTYKFAAGRADGDGTVTAVSASNVPAFLLVEDIGSATA